jgi:signal transduction histidine kinase
MRVARSHTVRRVLDAVRAWWLPTGNGSTRPVPDDAGMDQLYRTEGRRLHAARVPLTYTVFLFFGALATGLEFVSYPERRRAMLVAYAAFVLICLATMALVRRFPQWATAVSVLANNALILCAAAYYMTTRGVPEALALTLVLFLTALPLLNAAGAGVQALSCLGALVGYPLVLLAGAEPRLPVSYGLTAILGAVAVTVLGADLLDYGRRVAFYSREALRAGEEAVRRHQAELAHVARVSLIGEMAAGLAHELNQPLSAVVNFTRGCERRLRLGGAVSAEIVDALEQASAQALRAAEIVRRMRNFVRKEEPRLSRVDLNDLVRKVAQLAEPDGRHQGIRVHLALASSVPEVCVDSIQIEQVILNLVRNGFEAMNDGALVEKTLSVHTAAPDDAHVDVAISDTGIGLAPDLRERIFEPFFSTKPSGLGLGLSISRSIIKAHGGRLSVESDIGRGTTFRFTLAAEPRRS